MTTRDEWLEHLKDKPYFDYETSVWTECGYCNQSHYHGQIGGSIKLMGRIGYTNHIMWSKEEAVFLAERWLQEEHLTRCWKARKMVGERH